MNRRGFLRALVATSLAPAGCGLPKSLRSLGPAPDGVVVNDVHSALNATRVARVVLPTKIDALVDLVEAARSEGGTLSIAGGRHSMGGQQFATGSVLVDGRGIREIVSLDREAGIARIESGIEWPDLMHGLIGLQEGADTPWTIIQKQTGADAFTVAGSLSANGHGRGLDRPPLAADVEAFDLLGPDGEIRRVSRSSHPELFSLALGGYGLFGWMTTIDLRLSPRRQVERVVEVRDADGIAEAFEERIRDGHLYGDFQFDVDDRSERFLRRGVFATYRPVERRVVLPQRRQLSARNWMRFLFLTHDDKARAFDEYTAYYQSTNGQTYWSDTHQLSTYPPGYHREYDEHVSAGVPGSEMITELYVPRAALGSFLDGAAGLLRERRANVIYGTVRWIEKDTDTFLPWAREAWACTVLNLHFDHTPAAIERAKETFQGLIDVALGHGGSYFLTYHRWARKDQVLAAYPMFPEFLAKKRAIDPEGLFASDWHAHQGTLFV